MKKSEIDNILQEVGLSPSERRVYVSLLDGEQSVQGVIKATSEKRPTVYYSLNSLEKRGLVSKTGKEYGNKFQVEPIEKLLELVNKDIRAQNELLSKVKNLKDFYPTNKLSEKVLVSYFDDFASIKAAIFYSLYCKEKTIRSIVPAKNFFHETGRDFVEEYVKEKTKRKIKTIALWEDIPDKNIVAGYYDDLDIKQFPVAMHNSFDTTTFMYDDKTLYISPKKEQYAVLIQSPAHTKMMRAMFDTVWSNALPVAKPL